VIDGPWKEEGKIDRNKVLQLTFAFELALELELEVPSVSTQVHSDKNSRMSSVSFKKSGSWVYIICPAS
jgi:hypothetical protein